MYKNIREQLKDLGFNEKPLSQKPAYKSKKRKSGPKHKKCQFCNQTILVKNYAKHIRKAHPENTKAEILKRGYRILKPKCPVCDMFVYGDMKKHQRRHEAEFNKAAEKLKDSERTKKYQQQKRPTKIEARKQLEAIRDQSLGESDAVKSYLKRVPEKDRLGKFGTPQDKYRYNFFGHSSMCYDSWGRLNKIK